MTTQPGSSKGSSGLGLAAILVGIVLGAVLGATYGHKMWLASGGAEKRLERLGKTVEQKEDFARQAQEQGDPVEARRLRTQLPVIREEIQRIEALQAEASQTNLTVPRLIGEIVRFLGDIFLRMLLLVVIPLVLTSMICGVTSLGDISRLGKVSGGTLLYYMATCAAAVLLGIVLVQVIEPGKAADDTFAFVDEQVLDREDTSVLGTLLEVVRGRPDDPASGMIPANIFMALSKTNVLGLILFALVFGGALSTLGEKGKPAIAFFHAINDAVMKMVRLIICFTPVGVFGLIATRIADSGGADAFYAELKSSF